MTVHVVLMLSIRAHLTCQHAQFTVHSVMQDVNIHPPHLAAMSSSSPPQPQYWLGKPFIFMYWSGVTADTPPKYCGYGSLGGSHHQFTILKIMLMCPIHLYRSPSMLSTCIWTCPWPQTGAWGTVCGRCRCCGRSRAAGRHRVGRCSSSLRLWGPPAPRRSAAWLG